ncbi:hypothetical protein JFN87_00530 [Streptomyces bomunensis]|uniref:Uncharacterized protein n=2 Tax=Streptomyces montanisoli TaxID=2798581 RepID=A0A940M731_9ACTN|nr:hypothetical protein [Streptomyces montanisoli]
MDPRRVVARRAENLSEARPYVRGWGQAKRAAEALAQQLRAAGLETDFPGLKADVSVFGDGLVCLGTLGPDAAELLARLVAVGLSAEMAERAAG